MADRFHLVFADQKTADVTTTKGVFILIDADAAAKIVAEAHEKM